VLNVATSMVRAESERRASDASAYAARGGGVEDDGDMLDLFKEKGKNRPDLELWDVAAEVAGDGATAARLVIWLVDWRDAGSGAGTKKSVELTLTTSVSL